MYDLEDKKNYKYDTNKIINNFSIEAITPLFCLDIFTNTVQYLWKKKGKNGEPHFTIKIELVVAERSPIPSSWHVPKFRIQ